MKRWIAVAFSLAAALTMSSCGDSQDAATIYVLTPAAKATQFTGDLAVISRRHGLSPTLARSTDDQGRTYWLIEATGHWVRLWGTNMPLSAQENPDLCGKYVEGHPDPGQYSVTIDRVVPMIAKDTPRRLISDMRKELTAAGYDVRSTAVICSPLSKAQSGS